MDFLEGKSCLTKPIAFYSEMTRLVGEGGTVDVFYLDLGKDVTWMMGQSAPSSNFQITQNKEEWLIHQWVVLPSRGT